jgi:hypothetical protein
MYAKYVYIKAAACSGCQHMCKKIYAAWRETSKKMSVLALPGQKTLPHFRTCRELFPIGLRGRLYLYIKI